MSNQDLFGNGTISDCWRAAEINSCITWYKAVAEEYSFSHPLPPHTEVWIQREGGRCLVFTWKITLPHNHLLSIKWVFSDMPIRWFIIQMTTPFHLGLLGWVKCLKCLPLWPVAWICSQSNWATHDMFAYRVSLEVKAPLLSDLNLNSRLGQWFCQQQWNCFYRSVCPKYGVCRKCYKNEQLVTSESPVKEYVSL